MQSFSFAPDRRSVQNTYYSYNDRGSFYKRGFTQIDSFTLALTNIYKTNVPNMSDTLRNVLIKIIIDNIPLQHHNLTLIALATFISYNMNTRELKFTPETFATYFDDFQSVLIPDTTGKKREEIAKLRAMYKASLFRYMLYVINSVNKAKGKNQ